MTTPADELRAAAETLRAVAPEITGRLTGLADLVADWLDSAAAHLDRTALPEWQDIAAPRALAVARAINGSQP